MGIILVLIGQALQQDLQPVSKRAQSQCQVQLSANSSSLLSCHQSNGTNSNTSNDIKDLTHPLLIYCALGVSMLILLVVAFRPKYKRIEAEERALMLAKLQYQQDTPSASASACSMPESESMARLSDQENFRLSPRLAALRQATSTEL